MLFAPKFWQALISLQIDLIAYGILPWQEALGAFWSILVLNRQRPLELGLLGALEPAARARREDGPRGALLSDV